MDLQAKKLNERIAACNPSVLGMLSKRGRLLFFPKEGILTQSAESGKKRYNATMGVSKEEDRSIMALPCMLDGVGFPKEKIVSYSLSSGNTELRDVWKKMMLEKNPSIDFPVTKPVVTSALTHGLSVASTLFIDERDEVIMPNLFWENYSLMFEEGALARLRLFNLFSKGGFDLDSFKDAIFSSGDKKVIVLNFPNNPTGYTPTESEAESIASIIKDAASSGKKIVVLCDDAYFGLVYKDGVFRESIFSLLGNLHENVLAVKLDGVTKEDYSWGLRIGFISCAFKGMSEDCSLALEEKIASVIRISISSASTLSQNLSLKAFLSPSYLSEKKEKYELMKKRFELIESIISKEDFRNYFDVLPCNSGYFLCLRPKKVESEMLRKMLMEEYDTGVISQDGLIRLAFSSIPLSDMPVILDNILDSCRRLSR